MAPPPSFLPSGLEWEERMAAGLGMSLVFPRNSPSNYSLSFSNVEDPRQPEFSLRRSVEIFLRLHENVKFSLCHPSQQ